MDQLPDRPAALHRHRQVVDVVLARPPPSLPHLRPTGPVTQSRRPTDRNRPRPHLHLLGLNPSGTRNRRLTGAPNVSAQVGPTTSDTAGPVWVDIATLRSNARAAPLTPPTSASLATCTHATSAMRS